MIHYFSSHMLGLWLFQQTLAYSYLSVEKQLGYTGELNSQPSDSEESPFIILASHLTRKQVFNFIIVSTSYLLPTSKMLHCKIHCAKVNAAKIVPSLLLWPCQNVAKSFLKLYSNFILLIQLIELLRIVLAFLNCQILRNIYFNDLPSPVLQ